MHSEPAYASRADVRGRRRKRGNESAEGPVFVDSTGRRARLLRRFGLLLGAVCVGYAAILGLAFMGVGISVNPASLLPFGAGGGGGDGPGPGGGGARPQGGVAPTGAPPSGAPTGAPRSGGPAASPSALPTAGATAGAATATAAPTD
ncbi:hypothetical protein [Streptomyces sp. AC512_CC834]|uniref:hypothetical protein n=1 Tax=Streptomyces sp. AC512_CC834 TaxID=2823691 RepID=UPI001C27AD7F|nr:hypothetical protein [Streptomyces sp. AC512_CC834]